MVHAVVTQATVERVGAISEMYSRAFLEEPLLRWPLGDVPDPRVVIEAEFAGTHLIAAAHGCLWEVGDAQGGAGWISPQAAETYWNELVQGTRGVIAHAADGGVRHVKQWEWIASHYPQEPIWFLESIAVDPDRQGGGLGSALINHGLQLADHSGLPAFLETSSSHLVGYYQRFGFGVVAEGDVPGGGPRVWFMRRNPAPFR